MGRGALYKTQRERSVLRGEGVAQVVKGDKGPAWRGGCSGLTVAI